MSATNEERETLISQVATDRTAWEIYTNDPVTQRKFESIGAKLVKTTVDGTGKFYTILAEQISFRKGKKVLSPERRKQLGDRMRALHSKTDSA